MSLMFYKGIIVLKTLENTIFSLYNVALVNLKLLYSLSQDAVLDSHY